MRMKAIARQGIALLLAVLSLLSLVVGAMALEYDGSGTNDGGHASQTGSGKYGIISTNTSTNVIGYRFTGLKDGGTTKTDSIDVLLDNSWFTDYMSWGNGDEKYDNLYMMSPKYSKMDYHAAYLKYAKSGNDWSAFEAVAARGATFKDENDTIWESILGCPEKIPKTSAELDEWQRDKKNLNPVALKLGFDGGLARMSAGDKIIAEPLFCLLLEGHYYLYKELCVQDVFRPCCCSVNVMTAHHLPLHLLWVQSSPRSKTPSHHLGTGKPVCRICCSNHQGPLEIHTHNQFQSGCHRTKSP